MLKKNKYPILFFILLNLFFSINSFAQKNIFAGIEIGRRAIKVSVLDVSNIRKADYKILYFWTERIPFADHIAATGELTQDDINKTSITVVDQLKKLEKNTRFLKKTFLLLLLLFFPALVMLMF